LTNKKARKRKRHNNNKSNKTKKKNKKNKNRAKKTMIKLPNKIFKLKSAVNTSLGKNLEVDPLGKYILVQTFTQINLLQSS